ncbi:hypothetical protein AB0G48_25450 [Streptomyces rubiginosohelvolus]|uniref:hypothetical protein n=1 Tax=Streptomyces rubiginosohelvolus TaxID=67362 RepID=UPI0033E1D6A6
MDPPGTEPDPHAPGLEDPVPGLEDPENPFPKDILLPTEALMGAETRATAARLRAHGAPVTTHFYRGTHSPPQWERELRSALSALPRNLGRWGRR